MSTPTVEDVTETFLALERLESLRTQSPPEGFDTTVVESAIGRTERNLGTFCLDPKVKTALEERLASYAQDDAEVTQEALAQAREADPVLRLAERMLGPIILGTEAPKPDERKLNVERFFGRPPDEVAQSLTHMTLVVNGREVIIKAVRGQDAEFNAPHLNRPLFGPDRRDFYLARISLGRVMLFLRAGDADNTDCCVCVIAIKEGDLVIDKPTAVAEHLDLPGEHVGDLAVEDGRVTIVTLEPRPKPKKTKKS